MHLNRSTIVLWIVAFIFLGLTSSVAWAADIDILVNGQPLQASYPVKPGEQIEVTTRVEAGVLIKEVQLESNNPFFQEILAHAFESTDYHREATVQEKKATISLPSMAPSGVADIDIRILYDKDFEDKEFTTKTSLDIEDGSTLLGILGKVLTEQTAAELVNWLTNYQIPRANPVLTLDDLTKDDLSALGLTIADYSQAVSLFKESETLRSSGKKNEADAALAAARRKLPVITETASKETTPAIGELKVKSPKAGGELEGSLTPLVTLTEKTYSVKAGDKTITKSKLTLSVFAGEHEGISSIDTVVLVPKDIAGHVDEIAFGQRPTIVDPDPVVKWAFKNIPQDQVKDYTFTVDKDVQNFEVLAGATAERPSLMFRLIKWILENFMEKRPGN